MLPNIKEIINKHWHILVINNCIKESFNNIQTIKALRKNTTLKQLIGANTIKKIKHFSHIYKMQPEDNVPQGYTIRSPCSQQVILTTSFRRIQPERT